jgi:hypothetical protein
MKAAGAAATSTSPVNPRKEPVMRALLLRFLAPVAMAAAVLSTGGPAQFSAGPVQVSVSVAGSPAGANPGHAAQACGRAR